MDQHQKSRQEIVEFLNQNKEALTTVGLLGALDGFILSLPFTFITYFLTFFLTFALIVVWSTINLKGSEGDSIRLFLLRVCLGASFWLVILYTLLSYRVISWLLLSAPISLILLAINVKISRKSVIHLLTSKQIYQQVFGVILALAIFLASLGGGYILAIIANLSLDQIDHIKAALPLY